jgi:glycosyltransferase involved in cell wall biosynthesis
MSAPILIATVMRPNGDTGVQTHFRAYAAYLAAYAQPARLITPFDSPKWKIYPVFAIRRVLDLFSGVASVWWYRYWHAVFLRLALRRVLADGQPVVVYAQCPLSADAALRARSSEKQRVVMVVHFNISQADEWAGKEKISVGGCLFQAIRRFEFNVFPRLDGLVFVSDFMRNELIKRMPGIEKIRYRVLPNFLRDPGRPVKSESLLGDLICIGTLEPRKNQQYAIEIVAAAKKMGRLLCLTLVGDGPDRTDLEALCRNRDVADQVQFTGFVKNGSCLLPQHRACLHVAHIENLPLTLVEALAYGMPIFAPAVGGIPEVFSDGVEGRFVPLNDAHSAACLIVEWFASEASLVQAGVAARTRYLNSFAETRVAGELSVFLSETQGCFDRAAR